jgi:hypothetical protein
LAITLCFSEVSAGFDFGRISFFFTPRVRDDGSLMDISLGYARTESFASEIRLKFAQMAKIGPVLDAAVVFKVDEFQTSISAGVVPV